MLHAATGLRFHIDQKRILHHTLGWKWKTHQHHTLEWKCKRTLLPGEGVEGAHGALIVAVFGLVEPGHAQLAQGLSCVRVYRRMRNASVCALSKRARACGCLWSVRACACTSWIWRMRRLRACECGLHLAAAHDAVAAFLAQAALHAELVCSSVRGFVCVLCGCTLVCSRYLVGSTSTLGPCACARARW